VSDVLLPGWRSRPTVSRSPRTMRRPYATPFDPAMFCWSRAKVAFPAASNISLNRPGRIRRCTSGLIAGTETEGEPHVLIEAKIDEGVVSAPLSKNLHCQTRICRPVGLSEEDCKKVCRYASERIGLGYDFKNVIDLMRYLFLWPVTKRWRRRAIALGSGDPSRIICSSLIAQAFEAVRYPILPKITRIESQTAAYEIAEIRHASLYAPRDFDISPYFMVVKPTLARGFNYKAMHWAGRSSPGSYRTGHACSRDRRRECGGGLRPNFPHDALSLRDARAPLIWGSVVCPEWSEPTMASPTAKRTAVVDRLVNRPPVNETGTMQCP
jgi:hypothetical protein